jgi:hypothetical protein
MVTVLFSKAKELVLPESLGESLGLRNGDQVEVRRQDNILWFQRKESLETVGPLTDLAGFISTTRPVGSVDVKKMMEKRGYEQVDGRLDL